MCVFKKKKLSFYFLHFMVTKDIFSITHSRYLDICDLHVFSTNVVFDIQVHPKKKTTY